MSKANEDFVSISVEADDGFPEKGGVACSEQGERSIRDESAEKSVLDSNDIREGLASGKPRAPLVQKVIICCAFVIIVLCVVYYSFI